MSRLSKKVLAEDIESGLHVTREILYENAGSNRAMRRRAHKEGQYLPNPNNRPALRQEDGSYAPLTD